MSPGKTPYLEPEEAKPGSSTMTSGRMERDPVTGQMPCVPKTKDELEEKSSVGDGRDSGCGRLNGSGDSSSSSAGPQDADCHPATRVGSGREEEVMKSEDIQTGEEESILSSDQLDMICEQLEEISQLCAMKIWENVKMAEASWSVSQTPAGTTRNVVLEIIVGYGPDLEKGIGTP